MKIFLTSVSSLWIGIGVISSARALTADDIYCKEMPEHPPVYFSYEVKTCGDDKNKTTTTTNQVCAVNAKCAVIDSDSSLFQGLTTDEEKTAALQQKAGSIDWIESSLTCAKTNDGPDGTECPPPDECKGDIFFNAKVGSIDSKKVNDRIQRTNDKKGVIFHHKNSTTTEGTKSAK